MSRPNRILLLVVAFFLYFAHSGLHAYFSADDLMNIQHMHGYFTTPFYRVVLDILNPLSQSFRPMGGLFYRSLYAVAGFHPLPFRCACFALLILNLLLAYRLLRLLAGSTEAALLGTLGLSYHAEMYGLYINTGTIYDILCFTFFTAALILYAQYRRPPWIALVVLDLLALQSKEMAWTLPAIFVLYELLWDRRSSFVACRLAPVAATVLLTLASLSTRILAPAGLASSPFYHPSPSLTYYLQSCARYWGLILYSPGRVTVPALLAIWMAMALAGALLRSRALWFGLLFWMIAVIPVAVIPGRDAFVLYLPMLGLTLYCGVLLSRLREAGAASSSGRHRVVSQVCLFTLAAAGLAVAHTRMAAVDATALRTERQISDLAVQVRRLHPALAPHAHVLFVEDPFQDDWILGFLFRLLYNDPALWVDRAASRPHVRPYEYVFRYAADTLEELPPRLAPCSPQVLPAGLVDDSSPLLCWSGGWFSERFPQAAEGTLTYASDSGATVSIAFRGTALEYLCTKAFNRGLAEMTIDGVSRGVIDLYSPALVWQAPVRFEGLAPGEHTAQLRVLGRHNGTASDSIVDIDAFRAW